jgi:hypothetical protein
VTVPVIDKHGNRFTLDERELPEALRQGYRVETEAAPQTTGEAAGEALTEGLQTAGAAAEGAVEGVAPGLLGVTLGGKQGEHESPDAYRRRTSERLEVLKRQEEHPIAHGVGEFGGLLLSPIGEVGSGIKTGIGATTRLGRIAASGIAGTAEGALFGAGSTVNDTMLGDAELTADKLIAGTGLGALLGLGGGTVFSGVEEAARTVMPRLGRAVTDAQSTLDELANDAAVKATRAQQGVINRTGEAKLAEVAKVLRERGHLKLSPDEILKSLEGDLSKTGAAKGAFLDAADASGPKPNFGEALKAVDDFAAAKSPLERETIAPMLTKARTALEDIATDPKLGTWRAFDKWKQDLQSMAKFSRGAAEDDLALGLRRQLAGTAREELDRQLVPALGADGAKFLETKATYAALSDARRLAESGAGRAKPGGFGLGLYDLLAGVVGGSFHPAGIAAAIASKFMREKGPAIVAKLADQVSKSPALAAVAQSMGSSIGTVAPKLGPYGPALAQAFGQSPAAGLATHLAMSQVDPGYAATAQAVGLTHETPEEHTAALGKATGLAAISGAVKSGELELEKHLDRVMKGSGAEAQSRKVLNSQDFGQMRMRRDAEASHEQRVKEVRQLAADPQALLERVSGKLEQLGGVAPGVASALTARANTAVRYLAKSAEVPPPAGPLAPQWATTEAERHEFTQRLEVVQEPMSVMRHAAAGTLTDLQVETLKAVYPSLYKAMSDAALQRIAAGPKDVPYSARLMLSVLTGIDVDGTLSQGAIASNQQTIQSRGQKTENAAPQQQSSGARSEMTLAERTANPQQRREMETASGQA